MKDRVHADNDQPVNLGSTRREADFTPSCLGCGQPGERVIWHEPSGVYLCERCATAVRSVGPRLTATFDGLRERLAQRPQRPRQEFDLHHPFRTQPDGSPCWCVSDDAPHKGWIHSPACEQMFRRWVRQGGAPAHVDLAAIDRLLAVAHREDDQPCSCDECMSYGAEDVGADWARIPPANRIAIRILDGADDRFAVLAAAFRDHDAAATLDHREQPDDE